MEGTEVSRLLPPGLLSDVSILAAYADSPVGESFAAAMREAREVLGSSLLEWPLDAGEQALAERLRGGERMHLLALDAGSAFAAAAPAGEEASPRAALAACMRLSWEVTRTFAQAAIEHGGGGRIVLIAPAAGRERDGAGDAAEQELAAHARAARAGLENLARTLSIEWARYAITTVAILPSPQTAAGELAALCGYLASPAGAYFSGCVLPLGRLS
jgi:NAD(P)-dependent dehydrogenase (short-subunit alcohol dehydrogenase family)